MDRRLGHHVAVVWLSRPRHAADSISMLTQRQLARGTAPLGPRTQKSNRKMRLDLSPDIKLISIKSVADNARGLMMGTEHRRKKIGERVVVAYAYILFLFFPFVPIPEQTVYQ